MRSLGFYADDTVRKGRLTLNLGLRYDYSKGYFNAFPLLDRNAAEIGQSQKIDKLFDWNVISPRIGATVKLNDAGTTLIKANWGRYYRGVVTGEFDDATPSVAPRYLFSGLYDSRGNPLDLDVVSDNSNLRIDPEFENPYTDQYIVTLEHQLTDRIGVSVSGVYKKSENQSGWRDVGGRYTPVTVSAEGQSFTLQRLTSGLSSRILQLTNPGDISNDYTGFNLQVVKRMSNRWQGTVGITLSKSEGIQATNTARSTPTTSPTSAASNGFGQNPNDYVNADGRLIGDRPVLFKTQLLYDIGWGVTLAGNYQFQSGRPWGREVRFGNAVLGLGTTRVLFEPFSSDRRVDPINQVDLRIEKALRFPRNVEAAVFGDFLNALNNDAAQSVLDRRSTSANFGVPSVFVPPRRLMLGAKFRF
jgi:hypothetical protein